MVNKLNDELILWCVEHKVASIINWIVICLALFDIGVIISIKFASWEFCTTLKSWPIGTIGSIIITVLYAIRWAIEQGEKRLCSEQHKKIDALERKVNNLMPLKNNLEEIFDVWLLYALNSMQLGNGSRASFYVYDDRGGKNDQFCFIARESKDPRNKKKGRKNFPFNQGVIGAAWSEDDSKRFLFVSPKIKTDEAYLSLMTSEGGLPKDVAEKLTMKSKCILGGLIGDSACKVGVLVIEGDECIKESKVRSKIIERFGRLQVELSPYLCKLFKVYSDQFLSQEDPS